MGTSGAGDGSEWGVTQEKCTSRLASRIKWELPLIRLNHPFLSTDVLIHVALFLDSNVFYKGLPLWASPMPEDCLIFLIPWVVSR